MATSVLFNNKLRKRPGPYSRIISGIKNPGIASNFGNTLVINTGSEKFFTGGAGVNGTLEQKKLSQYTFGSVGDFQSFITGGMWWFLSTKLFSPGGGATAGVSSLTYVDAATTIAAEIPLLFGGQDTSDGDGSATNNGSATVQVRAEGFAGNAILGDEVRAKATITISNAGATGNIISILVNGISVGSYTKQAGDTIAVVVAGLAAAITALGLGAVFSSNATQVVIYAPSGAAATLNGSSPTVSVTGSMAGATTTFSGGVEGTILTRGYGAQVVRGVNNTAKYIVKFYRGSFKGLDTNLTLDVAKSFDFLDELSTVKELIATSPEISTVTELVTWMQDAAGAGYDFNQLLKLKTYTIATVDQIIDADLYTGTRYVKAAGGSSSFSSSDLTDALDSLDGLIFDFVLADNFDVNANSASNLAIKAWVESQEIVPDLYIAGGSQLGQWDTLGIAQAISLNSQPTSLVFGGGMRADVGGRTFKRYKSLYKAAALLGREAGIPPENPLTYKNIGIDGEVAPLSSKQILAGIDAGVLMTTADSGGFEVIRGINTLQNSNYLINPDGSSFSKQFTRIERQLNKLLVINAKSQLFKKPDGTNRINLSIEDVQEWTKGFLGQQIGSLIVNFLSVTVTRTADVYDITYGFEPNLEVSFMLFTGVALDPAA